MAPVVTAAPDPGSPTDLPRTDRGPEWTGRRRVLVEALARKGGAKSERAIGMYVEALRAIERNDGPESLHVAAYELREFMNALPQVLDLPVVPYEQLKAKVLTFVAEWKKKAAKTSCLKDGDWEGPIDDHLRVVLESTTTLVSWVEQQIPSRRTEAEAILRRLAPTEHPLPGALMEMRTGEWSELLGYFNHYTHHNNDPDPIEFRSQVDRLEGFLLDHLEPRTFEDQGEIDRLILEVEG